MFMIWGKQSKEYAQKIMETFIFSLACSLKVFIMFCYYFYPFTLFCYLVDSIDFTGNFVFFPAVMKFVGLWDPVRFQVDGEKFQYVTISPPYH